MYNRARAIEGLVDEPKILGWPRVMVRGFLGKLGFPGRSVVAIIGIFLNHGGDTAVFAVLGNTAVSPTHLQMTRTGRLRLVQKETIICISF